jgi:NAD(P)-dependent dehydrogenase (short-subunit alcohol dehydrogenase family)
VGRAIASALAADGDTVGIVCARDPARAEMLVSELRALSPEAYAVRADATDPDSVRALVRDTFERHPVAVWINALGAFLQASTEATSYEAWRHILANNLDSVFLCCRAVVPAMRDAGGGVIVNFGVAGAERGRSAPGAVAYQAAKSGLVALTRSLARAEGRHGIRVNQVNPGYIEGGRFTPKSPPARILLRRLGQPSEVAETVRFLASEEASYITGAVINVDGGAFQ